jgi:hypothetical protein
MFSSQQSVGQSPELSIPMNITQTLKIKSCGPHQCGHSGEATQPMTWPSIKVFMLPSRHPEMTWNFIASLTQPSKSPKILNF